MTMASEAVHPVRCASCRRTTAVAAAPLALKTKVYCNSWCAAEMPVTPNEARNDFWQFQSMSGMSPVLIGQLSGTAHSQVYKALDRINPRAIALQRLHG